MKNSRNILIMPDFGVKADSEAMAALRNSLEAFGDCSVRFLEVSGEPREAAKYVEESVGDDVDLLVAFDCSAMLCGGVRPDCDILFIDPEYTTDGIWRIQYYKDREKAEAMYRSASPALRVAIFSEDKKVSYTFIERYDPDCLLDPRISETTVLAQYVRDFAFDNFRLPMKEVYEAVREIMKYRHLENGTDHRLYMALNEPLKIHNDTIVALTGGIPMAKGQSGFKLALEGKTWRIPLESYIHRDDQLKLRDALRAVLTRLQNTYKPGTITPSQT